VSLAVITGSGALAMAAAGTRLAAVTTPYGEPSEAPLRVMIGAEHCLMLARHGAAHRLPPHQINYRANIDLLCQLGVTSVIALNTTGGISVEATPGSIVVPDQIVDYTWGREHTFAGPDQVIHADFENPFDESLRVALLEAGARAGLALGNGGVYGCTQGPRFETAAEIERMARDGCSLVGMTGMPEAGLARERGLAYAMVSLVVNPAAGRAPNALDLDAIGAVMAAGMARIETLLMAFTPPARRAPQGR